ncbi:hypothetical protein ONZ45_g14608 [Pleurotus djamor]|nr:hypothetical protein ONZ45_g14608 [Pleurotus djamor]
MSAITTNNNFGDGTQNNVYGVQNNYANCTLTIVSQLHPHSSQTSPSPSDPNGQYEDIIFNVNIICRQLRKMGEQQFSDGGSLALANAELALVDFSKMVVVVSQALDIIETIPGRIKLLSLFKAIPTSIQSFGKQIRELYVELQTLETDITRTRVPSIPASVIMIRASSSNWRRLSCKIGTFVEASLSLMGKFLASRCVYELYIADSSYVLDEA